MCLCVYLGVCLCVLVSGYLFVCMYLGVCVTVGISHPSQQVIRLHSIFLLIIGIIKTNWKSNTNVANINIKGRGVCVCVCECECLCVCVCVCLFVCVSVCARISAQPDQYCTTGTRSEAAITFHHHTSATLFQKLFPPLFFLSTFCHQQQVLNEI